MAHPVGFKIKHWTQQEWDRVVEMCLDGLTDNEIAREIGRTPSAVRKKRQDNFYFKREFVISKCPKCLRFHKEHRE